MKRLNKVIIASLIISINSSICAFASTNNEVLENQIFDHMKNWETHFVFNYDEPSALEILQEAAKKDGYLERSIAVYKTTRIGTRYEVDIDYRTTKEQEKYIDATLRKILSKLITPQMTELEKVRAINNYIVKIYKYDDSLESDNVYSGLTTGTTICQGYAMTAYKMFEILGIDSRIVNGYRGDTAHAWNLVKINDKWYHLDITNNDNIVRDKFLLKCDKYMTDNGFIWNKNEYPVSLENYYKGRTEYIDYNNDKEVNVRDYM